eukprot:TRINITY_DN29101_c0_g1_i2.p1 TRINITY_DN29101_c0_g1~~TRINITY_DN29101_c0_g1_i2.p1  ORF type:complete len:500 (+),score=79.28 TRINITY_DN29101_c0_g1_i2:136-1635(+)
MNVDSFVKPTMHGKASTRSYNSETARIVLATCGGAIATAGLGAVTWESDAALVYDLLLLVCALLAALRVFYWKEVRAIFKNRVQTPRSKQGKPELRAFANCTNSYRGDFDECYNGDRRNTRRIGQGSQVASAQRKAFQPAHKDTFSSKPKAAPSKDLLQKKLYPGESLEVDMTTMLRYAFPGRESDAITRTIVNNVKQAFRTRGMNIDAIVGFPLTSVSQNLDYFAKEVDVNISGDLREIASGIDEWSKALKTRHRDVSRGNDYAALKTEAMLKRALTLLTEILTKQPKFYGGENSKSVFGTPRTSMLTRSDVTQEEIVVNLYINNASVERQTLLTAECDRCCKHGAEFAFFVRRWAECRGMIASISKGHFTTYTWTILALHFLQKHESNERTTSTLGGSVVLSLFQDFLAFYSQRFTQKDDVIFVDVPGAAERDASAGGPRFNVFPRIEDPFAPAVDLGTAMAAEGSARILDELLRTLRLLEDGERKVTLLELLAEPE